MSIINLLPLELLTEIFKYIENNHKSLYSCILVNKEWHEMNISTLWRNPFQTKISVIILINCLLIEDRDLLTRNNIKLTFELLKKQPLHNYARFTTVLDFSSCWYKNLPIQNPVKFGGLKERLVKFILNYSN